MAELADAADSKASVSERSNLLTDSHFARFIRPCLRAFSKSSFFFYHGKVEDAVVRAVIEHKDGLKLQGNFGNDQTALIDVGQVVKD